MIRSVILLLLSMNIFSEVVGADAATVACRDGVTAFIHQTLKVGFRFTDIYKLGYLDKVDRGQRGRHAMQFDKLKDNFSEMEKYNVVLGEFHVVSVKFKEYKVNKVSKFNCAARIEFKYPIIDLDIEGLEVNKGMACIAGEMNVSIIPRGDVILPNNLLRDIENAKKTRMVAKLLLQFNLGMKSFERRYKGLSGVHLLSYEKGVALFLFPGDGLKEFRIGIFIKGFKIEERVFGDLNVDLNLPKKQVVFYVSDGSASFIAVRGASTYYIKDYGSLVWKRSEY